MTDPTLYIHISATEDTPEWSLQWGAVQDTWASDALVTDSVVSVLGNGMLEHPDRPYHLPYESERSEHEFDYRESSYRGVLRTKMHSSYEGQIYKLLLSLYEFVDRTEHPFFLGTHTGSYLRLPLIREMLRAVDPAEHYSAGVLTAHHESGPYESGALHILSRHTATCLLEHASQIQEAQIVRRHWCDDQLLGWYCRNGLEIPTTNLWRLNVVPGEPRPWHPLCYHYLFMRGAKAVENYHHYYRLFPQDRPCR